MQHYGVPTRLLDWTENPLVALYFAVSEEGHTEKDAALWLLAPQELNKLANLHTSIKHDIPFFGDDKALDAYLPSQAIAITTSGRSPVAILAPRQFRRLQAQSGVFTISHRSLDPLEETATQAIRKFKIPTLAKSTIAAELELLSVHKMSLFPELEYVGRHVKESNQ